MHAIRNTGMARLVRRPAALGFGVWKLIGMSPNDFCMGVTQMVTQKENAFLEYKLIPVRHYFWLRIIFLVEYKHFDNFVSWAKIKCDATSSEDSNSASFHIKICWCNPWSFTLPLSSPRSLLCIWISCATFAVHIFRSTDVHRVLQWQFLRARYVRRINNQHQFEFGGILPELLHLEIIHLLWSTGSSRVCLSRK